MKKLLSLLLAVSMAFGMLAVAHADGPFTPGTYVGTAPGYVDTPEAIKVTVTVDENAITAIEIEGAGEVPFGQNNVFPVYSESLIGRADADVDAIAGATLSSNGVKEAVEKAVASAARSILVSGRKGAGAGPRRSGCRQRRGAGLHPRHL